MSLTKASYSMITGAPINVLDYGADPTGVTDSTAAIQAALDAGGVNSTVVFPKGTYLLSATLEGAINQNLVGAGPNQTVFRRFTDYGDTLRFVNIGAGSVRNIWFYHGVMPSSGFTSLANLATSGAHLHIEQGQGAIIEDCWFWRMPFQIQLDRGSLYKINRCNAQGCWNVNATAAAQEGIAGIYIGGVQYCVLVEITNCYLGGADGGPQSIPFNTVDNGTQVVNFTSTNAGNQYGILVTAVEGLVVDNTYIGGNVYNNILFSPNNICAEIRLSNNFIDGSGYNSPCIYFQPAVDGYYAINVTISDNTFNGQLYAYQAIGSLNPFSSLPTIACFTINDNSFVNGLGSAIFLRNAQDGTISGNQIASYNSRNLSPGGDVNYCNAIFLSSCTSVLVDGNIVGGAINSGAVGGYTYRGIDFGGTINNLTEKNTVHVGTGPSANIVGKVDKYTVFTTTSYTCTGVEDLVLTDSSSGTLQVFLPTNPPKGMTITVKDSNGSLTTNNIGVIGTIDGVTNLVMSVNYMSRTFTYNGTSWNITAGFK